MPNLYFETVTFKETLIILGTIFLIYTTTFLYRVVKTNPTLSANIKKFLIYVINNTINIINSICVSIKNMIKLHSKKNELIYAENTLYPILQNIIYELVLNNYSVFQAKRPDSVSSVLTTGPKISESPFGYVYNYEILLTSSTNLLDEKSAIEILQKELLKKSANGLQGVTFYNGYPIINIHEVLYTNNYMQIRLVILWNYSEYKKYTAFYEQCTKEINPTLHDGVF